MSKRTDRNTRIIRKYLVWLQEARGLSTTSVDRAAASIARFERFSGGADFGAFHAEKARAFKRHLDAAKGDASGRPLSASVIDATLRDLKAFFGWLADQPGYKSKVSHSDAAYFTPSRRLAKSAHGGAWRAHPSIEQALHAIRSMPAETLLQRRDRAAMAMLLLTGARDGSLITLRLANIDVTARCVHFKGREIETKFGKAFTTWFLPVGEDVERFALDWLQELRQSLLFGPGDPILPRQKTGLSKNGGFQAAGLEAVPYASSAPVAAICRNAFVAAGLPPFTPHPLRKTLVDLASVHCRTPEQFKAWSQNIAHEDVLTTFRSYGAVAPGRQGELIRQMTASSDDLCLIDDD
ncbi:MAG: integrase [Pseudomonadota bacterium]